MVSLCTSEIGWHSERALYKAVPVDNVLGDVLDGIFEVEPVTVSVQWSIVALLKANLVHTVAELELLRVFRHSVQTFPAKSRLSFRLVAEEDEDSHQPLPIRDSTNEPTTRLHPFCDVRQHRPDFFLALEGVMHAKLQRDDIKGRRNR